MWNGGYGPQPVNLADHGEFARRLAACAATGRGPVRVRGQISKCVENGARMAVNFSQRAGGCHCRGDCKCDFLKNFLTQRRTNRDAESLCTCGPSRQFLPEGVHVLLHLQAEGAEFHPVDQMTQIVDVGV